MLTDHFAQTLPKDIRPINDGKTWEVSRAFSIEYGQRHHNFQRKAACILATRSEEHTSELQSLMRISYAVFCLKKKKKKKKNRQITNKYVYKHINLKTTNIILTTINYITITRKT